MSVLRAWGDNFDVDKFLKTSDIDPCLVYHTDDRRGMGTWGTNGFNAPFSDAEFEDIETQINDAIAFLQRYKSELKRLVGFDSVESVCLDFALRQRDAFMFSDSLPAKLLALADNLGIDIVMSYYIPSRKSD
jgi:hypothetical protein